MKVGSGARAAPATIEKRLNGITGIRRMPSSRVDAAGLDHLLEPVEALGRPTNR